MSNVIWLLVLLAFAAAAVILTLAFVVLADRRLSEGNSGRKVPRREGADAPGHEPGSGPRDQSQDRDGGGEEGRSP